MKINSIPAFSYINNCGAIYDHSIYENPELLEESND